MSIYNKMYKLEKPNKKISKKFLALLVVCLYAIHNFLIKTFTPFPFFPTILEKTVKTVSTHKE